MPDTSTSANDNRVLFSPAEFQRRAEMGKTKFYRLVKEGQIEVIKIGRHTRVPADAFDRFIAAMRRETAVQREAA